ncbi:MerR family transcriptional regulator [Oscillospiraceae bacterium PP1C4]
MNTYKTTEVAQIIGIHANTVRLYETLGLIPKPERQANGYRIFTDLHIEQFKLARIAFKIEVLQNGLRKTAVEIVKISATGDFDKAIFLTNDYLQQIQKEQQNAEEAIQSVKQLLSGERATNPRCLKRKEAAEYLHISMDALRNWEMNGLLTVKRKENGYRVYTDEDIRILKIIRSLRCANYSLESILRMLHALSYNPQIDIKKVLDTPQKSSEIISECDKLITSLKAAGKNAQVMLSQIKSMKEKFDNPTL